MYVESLVTAAPWPGSGSTPNEAPPDFKFFTFGSNIVTCFVVLHRKTDHMCMLWVDEDWKRQDLHGCTLKNESKSLHWPRCSPDVPPPKNWPNLVATAKKLGEAAGIHFRIDLYDDAHRGALLGEFTPFHSSGLFQCAVVAKSWSEGGGLDPCSLGRAWKNGEGPEGSPLREIPSPPREIMKYVVGRNWTFWGKMPRKAQEYLCDMVVRKDIPEKPSGAVLERLVHPQRAMGDEEWT